jgi:hypothetical protein
MWAICRARTSVTGNTRACPLQHWPAARQSPNPHTLPPLPLLAMLPCCGRGSGVCALDPPQRTGAVGCVCVGDQDSNTKTGKSGPLFLFSPQFIGGHCRTCLAAEPASMFGTGSSFFISVAGIEKGRGHNGWPDTPPHHPISPVFLFSSRSRTAESATHQSKASRTKAKRIYRLSSGVWIPILSYRPDRVSDSACAASMLPDDHVRSLNWNLYLISDRMNSPECSQKNFERYTA